VPGLDGTLKMLELVWIADVKATPSSCTQQHRRRKKCFNNVQLALGQSKEEFTGWFSKRLQSIAIGKKTKPTRTKSKTMTLKRRPFQMSTNVKMYSKFSASEQLCAQKLRIG
jgi:hypothetical protein